MLAASRAGTKLLFTGAIVSDPYGDLPDALRELGVINAARPVRFHEMSRFGSVTFDRNLQESLLTGPTLPLEFAREDEPLVALLRDALASAGVQTNPSEDGVAARLLDAPRAVLAVFVNETAQDAKRRVVVAGRTIDVVVPAGRSRLTLFDRATGKAIADTSEVAGRR